MNLQDTVVAAFTRENLLAAAYAQYTPRAGQIAMAKAVAHTLERGGCLVAEAGTGVGKTFAYLVPILLSGQRALISTATKALQDQLALRDIPRLMAALDVQVRVSVLKGRSSYLCLSRLESARQQSVASGASSQRHLAELERWSTHTRSGDLAELQDWPEQSPLEPLVTSTHDNCLGSACPQAAVCFVNRARREAMVADLVVVNHHLFFADLNVRESGVAELLPQTRTVVFDEAHQLNDIGVQFMGQEWSTRQVDSLCKDLDRHASSLALGSSDWRSWVAELRLGNTNLKALCTAATSSQALAWTTVAPQGVAERSWQLVVASIVQSLQQILGLLQLLQEPVPQLEKLADLTQHCLDSLSFFTAPTMVQYTRWVECSTHLKMHCAPLDISKALASHIGVFDPEASGQRAWIFTSATLGTDPELALFRTACGLEASQVMKVDSPFDYAAQAALYIPTEFPLPADPLHSIEVAHLAAQAASVLGGRTMVLTTSLRAMNAIGEALAQQLGVTGAVEVLVQGQLSKREILSRFTAACAQGSPGKVVVASASFWEGVDIPGDALQLVIIDKIPFLSPDGALTQAREEQLRARGLNPFKDFHLPHAALGLKQGAGRLIRSASDRGVLVICDPRLVTKSYGKKVIAALPPMRRLTSLNAFQVELKVLTKISTMDFCWT